MINAGLQKIPGFETTDYAYAQGQIVWTGKHAVSVHPRNYFSAWQAPSMPAAIHIADLAAGSGLCISLFTSTPSPSDAYTEKLNAKGLLLWLMGTEMPFPMNLSTNRFDAIKNSLKLNDIHAFGDAALKVLGLGTGLTPSGDDFVGGIFFALTHAPRKSWESDFDFIKQRVRTAAMHSTNVISAALLDDMLAGQSFTVLHDLLHALQVQDETRIKNCCTALLSIGSTSGADMLAGVLLALTTRCEPIINQASSNKH